MHYANQWVPWLSILLRCYHHNHHYHHSFCQGNSARDLPKLTVVWVSHQGNHWWHVKGSWLEHSSLAFTETAEGDHSITTSARIGSAKRHSTKSIQNCKLKTLKLWKAYFTSSDPHRGIPSDILSGILHSFWHSIWQSIWHLIQTYFLAFHSIVKFFLTFYLASILTFGLAFFLHLDPSVPHSIWRRYGVQCSLHSAEI